MTKILAFCGEKQSGKTSAAAFVTGYMLQHNNVVDRFTIDDDGDLIVPSETVNSEGETIHGEGVLDLNRRDPEFLQYAHNRIWPHVKIYNFADPLKETIHHVFGVSFELLYGTDDDKNTLTHIKWKDMPLSSVIKGRLKKEKRFDKRMTIRELMQTFGTEVCRKIDNDCWVRACWNRIQFEQPEVAVIADCRFDNERLFLKKNGSKLIRLVNTQVPTDHASEQVSMREDDYNLMLYKHEITLREKNEAILNRMVKWGWLNNEV
jgi:hypothetical protein